MILRLLFALAILVSASACTSSRETAREGSFAISEEENGDINIVVSEDASPETVMAALMAAASRMGWTPPETAGPLQQIETGEAGESTRYFRYGLDGGRFDVFVYIMESDADAQIADTQTALKQLVELGRLDAFEQIDRTQEAVPWADTTAVLHHVTYSETVQGEPWDSAMYLLKDDIHWIKVRVSYPKGTYTRDDMDGWVRDLLDG